MANSPSDSQSAEGAGTGSPAAPDPGQADQPSIEAGQDARLDAQGRNDLFTAMAVVWIAINLIDVAPRRVRRAFLKQEEAVLRAVQRFGFRLPILVRTRPDGRYEVIDGHVRLAVARRLAGEQVPCIVVDDLPDVELRRLAVSLNKLQETGKWDEDAPRLEINEIIEIDGDLDFPGFELPEIEAMHLGPVDGTEPDPADDASGHLDPAHPVVTRPGDVWILGDHRIACGSARDGAALARLTEDVEADAIFTDPPYNVRINGHVRGINAGFEEFAEASGEMSPVEFTAFLAETIGNAAGRLRSGGVLFVCMDWRHTQELEAALDGLGLDLLNVCVWVKSAPGMGSLYRSQHEFVFVAKKPGAQHRNNVRLGQFGRNRSNVWTYAGATGGPTDADDDFVAHPTVKPIRVVMDALLDVTAPGDVVLDPFLGSGTTLLAAERTRRKCVGVEIEPAYVDLAIRRWQEMTAGPAMHVQSGVSYDEIAGAVSDGREVEGTEPVPPSQNALASPAPTPEEF